MLAVIHGPLELRTDGQADGVNRWGNLLAAALLLPIIFLPLKTERVSVVSDMQETLAIYMGFCADSSLSIPCPRLSIGANRVRRGHRSRSIR
jgi:hypothetical protein